MRITNLLNWQVLKLSWSKVCSQKSEPRAIYFKTSYEETEFQKALVIKRKKDIDVEVKRAYTNKPGLADRKKSDLIDLVNKKMTPSVEHFSNPLNSFIIFLILLLFFGV